MNVAVLEDRVFDPRHVVSFLCFALSAGLVNAGAVMATNTVVSHVTGNVTTLGLDPSTSLLLFVAIALFIGGAMTATAIAHLVVSKSSAFTTSISLTIALLLATAVAGQNNLFAAFGEAESATRSTLIMLALLSFAMGLLNSAVATATKNQVRTTHLSGPATDLAGNLVRGLLDRGQGTVTELRWAALRLATILSFGVGAFAAVKLANVLQYELFALASATLTIALSLTSFSSATSSVPKASQRQHPAARRSDASSWQWLPRSDQRE